MQSVESDFPALQLRKNCEEAVKCGYMGPEACPHDTNKPHCLLGRKGTQSMTYYDPFLVRFAFFRG